MTIQRVSFQAVDTDSGRRLDEVLAERLPEALGQPVSRGKVRKLIRAGAVTLNGQRTRIATLLLRPGARIEAGVDLERLNAGGTARDRRFVMGPERILFEDAQLLIVDKPAGLPTQPTLDGSRDNLFAAVRRFLAERAGANPDGPAPYLALHHRLDRDTSGALLLVKDPAANAAIAHLFAERQVHKEYLALTAKPATPPAQDWTTRSFLAPEKKRPGGGKRTRFTSVRSGGKPAHTDLRVVETLARALLVAARPHTGRTHQIRVHLAEAGLPILGDDLYGPAARAPGSGATGSGAPEPGAPGTRGGAITIPRLMLHAAALTFPDPTTGAEITVTSPLPPDFQECLHRHRAERSPSAPRPQGG